MNYNRAALGLDVGSERNRREAADLARDSGQAALTKRIQLVQVSSTDAASLLYAPVYRGGGDPGTVEKRRALLAGWIYAPISTKSLFQSVVKEFEKDLQATVYDGDNQKPENEIFRLGNTAGKKTGRVSK